MRSMHTNSIKSEVKQTQFELCVACTKVVCLHCANNKLETYYTIWHNKCHIWRILRLRLVSFTLQRPSEDPNWTASTPDRKPARPTCKDSTTSFGLTGRPSRSNQQTTVRLLYPRYMYINLLCIVCSLYIFIVYHSLDVHMSWLSFISIAYQNFSVFAPKKATAFRLKCVAWKNHRGVEHRSLVVCCNLQSHNLRGFNSRLQRAARSTGELRFLIHVPTGFEVARGGFVNAYRFISFESFKL